MESFTFLQKLPASNYRTCEAANNAAGKLFHKLPALKNMPVRLVTSIQDCPDNG